MGKKSSMQCYICGKWSNSYTRDHVPPKCLAGDVPGIQFMSAPACLGCNQKFSPEESKFRDFLAMIGSNLGVKEADGALEAFGRNVSRRPGPNKDYNRIVERISEEEIYSGKIYLGTAPAIRVPEDIDISGVITKIAQGLHYAHTKGIIPSWYERQGMLLQPEHVPSQFHQAVYYVVGQVGEFFHYKGWWKVENANCAVAVWVMVFYQRAYGIAWFRDPNFVYPTGVTEGPSEV